MTWPAGDAQGSTWSASEDQGPTWSPSDDGGSTWPASDDQGPTWSASDGQGPGDGELRTGAPRVAPAPAGDRGRARAGRLSAAGGRGGCRRRPARVARLPSRRARAGLVPPRRRHPDLPPPVATEGRGRGIGLRPARGPAWLSTFVGLPPGARALRACAARSTWSIRPPARSSPRSRTRRRGACSAVAPAHRSCSRPSAVSRPQVRRRTSRVLSCFVRSCWHSPLATNRSVARRRPRSPIVRWSWCARVAAWIHRRRSRPRSRIARPEPPSRTEPRSRTASPRPGSGSAPPDSGSEPDRHGDSAIGKVRNSGVTAAVLRGGDAAATAVSLIIGFPRRVTTTSWPAATWSSHCPNESRQGSAPTVTAASSEFEWS